MDSENTEATWDSSFKIRAKIEIKEQFISQTIFLCRAICFSKVRFSLAFYHRNLAFSP